MNKGYLKLFCKRRGNYWRWLKSWQGFWESAARRCGSGKEEVEVWDQLGETREEDQPHRERNKYGSAHCTQRMEPNPQQRKAQYESS
ncbi:unnamed protein product [Arctogadus glacialis]